MRVSVVMPAYNEERWIGEALDSLSRQTLSDFELIVVDDGSTDATGRIAASFGARVIRTPNGGAGAGRDTGGRAACGDVLVFADADEVYPPEFVERMVEPLRDPKVSGTFPGLVRWHNPDEGLAPGWLRVHGFANGRQVKRGDTHPYPKALRREDFLRVGGYPRTGRGEEYLFGRLVGPAVCVPGLDYGFTVPTGTREVFGKARAVGRGPLFSEHRPPLRRILPPVSWWEAGRFAARGDFVAAWVRLLWDVGMSLGLVEGLVRPRLRAERELASRITAASPYGAAR